MGVWLSGENGQDTNLSNFALMYFLIKKGKFQTFVCVGTENTMFPHMLAEMAKFCICTRFGLWANICTKMWFLLGHVGSVVLFRFLGPPHLALNPPYSCWFVLFFVFFLVWNNFQYLPFFLLRLPFSLFFFSLFLPSLFFFLLYCFGVSLSCLVSLLLFHEMNFGVCRSYLLTLFLWFSHEMNNFKTLNWKGFFHKSFLFLVSEWPHHLTLEPSIF